MMPAFYGWLLAIIAAVFIVGLAVMVAVAMDWVL